MTRAMNRADFKIIAKKMNRKLFKARNLTQNVNFYRPVRYNKVLRYNNCSINIEHYYKFESTYYYH